MAQNRDYFTSQGFHLNALGKKWISNELVDSIRLLCDTFKKTPSIQLPWKNEDRWLKPRENEDTRINKVQDGKMKILSSQQESKLDREVGYRINRQSDNNVIVNIMLEQERTDTDNCGKDPHMEGTLGGFDTLKISDIKQKVEEDIQNEDKVAKIKKK
jgi:hypothetical protein